MPNAPVTKSTIIKNTANNFPVISFARAAIRTAAHFEFCAHATEFTQNHICTKTVGCVPTVSFLSIRRIF